jgi:hypothetical protein
MFSQAAKPSAYIQTTVKIPNFYRWTKAPPAKIRRQFESSQTL